MIPAYLILAARIRNELEDLDHVLERIGHAFSGAVNNQADRDFYIDSVALNLHDLYSGFERMFQQIASVVDGHMPEGRDWHRELLSQMTFPLPEVRSAVLSEDAAKILDELLRFRHVVRNVYAFSFDFVRISRIVEQINRAYSGIKNDLVVFADFLELIGKD